MTEKKTVVVAIGALIRTHLGRAELFITRRSQDAALGGFWELPGGKIEPGESSHDCLIREFREEVGLPIRPTQALDTIAYEYDHANVTLHPWLCELAGESSAANPGSTPDTHRKWVTVDALDQHRFPPANASLMRILADHMTARDQRATAAQGGPS